MEIAGYRQPIATSTSTPVPRSRSILSRGRLTSLVLSIYSTKVCWYDLRIIFEALRGEAFRDLFVIYGILLGPFIAIICFCGISQVFRSRVLQAVTFICVYGLALNAFQENPVPSYILQDLFKLAFIPTGFLLLVLDTPRSCDLWLRRLAICILFYLIVKFVVALTYYHATFGLYYGGTLDLFPFCYYGSKYSAHYKKGKLSTGVLAIVSLLLALIGQKRTVLLAASVVILYLLVANWKTIGRKGAIYLLLAIGGILGVFLGPAITNSLSDNFKRVVQFVEDTPHYQETLRFREIVIVLETIQEQKPLEQLLGLGHGAVFENESSNPYAGEYTHSVHFTPAAMLLRYGVCGVVFFLLIAISTVRGATKPTSNWMMASDAQVLRSYGIIAVLGSMTLYGLVDDMLIGACLGATYIERRKGRLRALANSRTNSPAMRIRNP